MNPKALATAILFAIAVIPLSAGAREAGQCALTEAHYTLSSDASVTMKFIHMANVEGWRSDVALELDKAGSHPYWFMFDRGSARYINLISTTDIHEKGWVPPVGDAGVRPLGEMHFFAWSGKYQFTTDIPSASTVAPDQIFLPDLSDVMAYRANPRVDVAYGVFLKDGCK